MAGFARHERVSWVSTMKKTDAMGIFEDDAQEI